MSTLTPRLQLKSWDASDPFLRQDFVDNNNKLDAAPGLHICTLATLPTWSTAQAHRNVWITDQKRMLEWTGTTWSEPLSLTPGFATNISPNQYIAPNTQVIFDVGQWIVPRGGLYMSIMQARIGCVSFSAQEVQLSSMVNGFVTSSAAAGACRWNGSNGDGSPDNRMITSQCAVGAAPGNPHVIQSRIYNSTGAPSIYVGAISVMMWLVSYGM